jgi:ABC-type oligopeptide transport system substrate-binding subunit
MKRTSLILMAGVVLVCLPVLPGCSTTQTEQQTTTTRTDSNNDPGSVSPNTTTTTTKTDTQSAPSQPDSVLGATANAVGTVIAAPFRLVGDAFEIVF